MNQDTKPIRVRFAPSPTGYLHVGGARTALFNWLFARKHGGKFILRIEDTDAARNTPEALAAILDGMRWLSLDWDEGPEIGGPCGPYFQSQRQEIYCAYLDRLITSGHVYDDNGAMRFRSPGREIVVDDQVCGQVRIDRGQEPDMTVRRPDGSFIFHFVNVVDDIEMGITHVMRGEDHLMNTPKHIELFEALGAPLPVYAHIPLFLNPTGSKMSKRDVGASVSSYVEEGYMPEAVVNYLCLLGWSPKDDREKLSLDEVMALFDWDHINRAPSKFDITKCQWLNSQYLAELAPENFVAKASAWISRYAPDLSTLAGTKEEQALLLVRPKIKHLPELREHFLMLFDAAAPLDEPTKIKVAAQANGRTNLETLARHLAELADWSEAGIQTATAAAAKELAVKPGALLFPLRVAITGCGHGADLAPALVMLGKEVSLARMATRIPLLFP